MPTQNVNQVAKKIGWVLISAGERMVKSAYKIKSVEITATDLATFVNDITVIQMGLIERADTMYRVGDWANWEDIILYDLQDTEKWILDFSDCDNFSFSFASRSPWLYGLNSCGVASGWVYRQDGSKYRHSFNLIVAFDIQGNLQCYYYDAISDNWAKVEKGKNAMINNGRYVADTVLFF